MMPIAWIDWFLFPQSSAAVIAGFSPNFVDPGIDGILLLLAVASAIALVIRAIVGDAMEREIIGTYTCIFAVVEVVLQPAIPAVAHMPPLPAMLFFALFAWVFYTGIVLEIAGMPYGNDLRVMNSEKRRHCVTVGSNCAWLAMAMFGLRSAILATRICLRFCQPLIALIVA
jgi:hypothetical protein